MADAEAAVVAGREISPYSTLFTNANALSVPVPVGGRAGLGFRTSCVFHDDRRAVYRLAARPSRAAAG